MTRLVIVADDLTGAADSAVPMVTVGSASIVLDRDGEWPTDDVVAIDTDSRHRSPDVAAARAGAAADRARRLGACLFKKVDSTLRGNIAAEVRAMAEGSQGAGSRPLVVLALAFPATGRTTVGGVVHVHGSPLAAQGSDGSIPDLLRQGGLRAASVGLEQLSDPATLAAAFDRAHTERFDAVVADSETEEHLALVVAATRLADRPLLLVGSGGLARPLAASLAGSVTPPARRHGDRDVRTRRPALVVVGSYAAESRAQRDHLARRGVRHVVLTERDEDAAAQLREGLLTGPVLLSPDPDLPVVAGEAPEVARRLATAAAAALDRAGTLVVTGGETARAVLTTAGVARLTVRGEVAPGVVCSHAPSLDLDVVTKAGAFGGPDTLLRCLFEQRE